MGPTGLPPGSPATIAVAKPRVLTAHMLQMMLRSRCACMYLHASRRHSPSQCLLLVVQMPLPVHTQAEAHTTDRSGFRSSANEASSAAVMLKTLKRLNQVC